MPTAVFLANNPQPSFKIIGDLMVKNLQEAGVNVIERGVPATPEERLALSKEFEGQDVIFFHHTAGYSFQVIPGARNIAIAWYEFSRFPEPWVKLLNNYDEVWVGSTHVSTLLKDSGVTKPIVVMRAALDREPCPQKIDYTVASGKPFQFLFVGEPHFRKGVHFLMYGFVKAFPKVGEAELIIKTSPTKDWVPLREDIKLITERLPKEEVCKLYTMSDCYISASLAEGLGMPIAEAMLSGLPVCTNNWGGHQDMLTTGGYFPLKYKVTERPWAGAPQFFTPGQMCALSDENAVADAMLKIVKTTPAQRLAKAKKARTFIQKTYGTEALKPVWLEQVRRLWKTAAMPGFTATVTPKDVPIQDPLA